MIDDPSQLLGRRLDAQEVRAFLDAHDATSDDQPDPERTYFCLDRSGIEILVEEQVVHTIFLYGSGHDGKGPYVGPVPFGLTWDMGQLEVRALLGTPEFEAPARDIKYLGPMGPMERYRLTPCRVHVEYSASDGRIAQLTLMTHEAAPQTDVIH